MSEVVSSAKKIYTAAIVGTGRIGFSLGFDKKREQPASHTMALKENPRVKIVAGIDTNKENLALWKEHISGAATFSSLKEMASHFAEKRKDAPDIIVVAVNEDAHLAVTLDALKCAPRLLILEKPVALNMREAAVIKRAAKKSDIPILVNHERRFALDYNTAADYLKNIGGIQKIEARLFSGMRLYDPAAEESGGYSLLHDGTHLVDIVLFMLERIGQNEQNERGKKTQFKKAASGRGASTARPLLRNPEISGIFRDPKDKHIVRQLCAHYKTRLVPEIELFMSGRSRFFGFELDILGTEGRINLGNGFARFYRRAESKLYSGFYSLEEDKKIILPQKTGYFSNMVKNAVAFLDGKAELKSTLQTGMAALTVLEEIKSAL